MMHQISRNKKHAKSIKNAYSFLIKALKSQKIEIILENNHNKCS